MSLRDRMAAAARLVLSQLRSRGWRRLPAGTVLLVRHDGDCGYEYEGRAYAHVLDSFGDWCRRCGISTTTVATPYSVLMGRSAHGDPGDFNREAARTAVGARLIRLIHGGDRWLRWIDTRREQTWGQILDRVKPTVVVGIQPEPALCRAARERSIRVCDLQHGVIAAVMPWYGASFRASTPSEDLPDTFLCWTEDSAATVREWAEGKGCSVHVVGNPWFERFRDPADDDGLVQEALRNGTVFRNGRPVVLHTLSWGMDLYYPEPGFNGFIPDALVEVILNTAGRWNWAVRLHPVQLRGREARLAEQFLAATFGHLDCVEWRASSRLPLPVILSQVHVHVTDLSSTVMEAGWFGIRSGLLNPLCASGAAFGQLYATERSRGLAAVLQQDAEAITCWLEDALAAGREFPAGQVRSANVACVLHDILTPRLGEGSTRDRRGVA